MISQTPEQRLLYDARLKFHRDEESKLREARQEGEARGQKLGRITLLQELLGIRPSTAAEIAGYDEIQLNDLTDQLQDQLRSRG
jgi:transposase